MAVRNCADIGENLQKIITRLLANQDLLKLLYYTDKDPLSQPDLTEEQKKKEIFEKLIKIVPRIGAEEKEGSKSFISISVVRGMTDLDNNEFKIVKITVEVFVPLTQWLIKNFNLRPFAILGELQKTLSGKTINGLGKMSGGDFELNFLTEETSCYEQTYSITSYD
jgi:hypothetical protein